MNIHSDTLSSPPRLCTDTSSSSQNSSRYRNMSANLYEDEYKILNILEEMLEGSNKSENVLPEIKKRSEVLKDSTSQSTTVENRL